MCARGYYVIQTLYIVVAENAAFPDQRRLFSRIVRFAFSRVHRTYIYILFWLKEVKPVGARVGLCAFDGEEKK